MMRLLKNNLPQQTEEGRVPYDNMLQVGQVRPELVVMDPNDAYVAFISVYMCPRQALWRCAPLGVVLWNLSSAWHSVMPSPDHTDQSLKHGSCEGHCLFYLLVCLV